MARQIAPGNFTPSFYSMKEDSPSLEPAADGGPTTAESILAAYRPSREPIVVRLPNGETMRFRPIVTTKERDDMIAAASRFLRDIPRPGSDEYEPHFFAGVAPEEDKSIALSFFLHYRAIEPPISQRTALEMHQAPELMDFIERALDLADKNIVALARQRAAEELRGKSTASRGSGEG